MTAAESEARVREPLWQPTAAFSGQTNFAQYLAWLERERGLHFDDYQSVWQWSVKELELFWGSLWDFFDVKSSQPYSAVLRDRAMPGAQWFQGAQLNYAEHVFRQETADRPALLFQSEHRPLAALGWAELRQQVGSVAALLREMGVGPGDRVAAYLPNIPEAVVTLLACASIGAVWSCCSPDFGTQAAIERFQQIEPHVLFAVDGYVYGGKRIDRLADVSRLRQGLPSVKHTVVVPNLDRSVTLEGTSRWHEMTDRAEPLAFEQVPFDHPLWILYSSGTTGPPKAIVHGHGGILLEHMKALALQNDMRPGDRLLWFTTTGWMMWNLMLGSMLLGAAPVLYDGSAGHPDLDVLWKLAEAARVTRFGAGSAYFIACMKAGLRPVDRFDLGLLRVMGATGSLLPPEAFRWIYAAVKHDVWLGSSSGGTDVCTAFLGGCPMKPVHEGELQGAALGVSALAYDEAGKPVVDQVGELVITEPMPSMPLFLWNDPDGSRYRETYFDVYPGVWRHGDWIRFTPDGGAVISGRSDATLNRLGVRIGSSEIYRAVEAIPEITDSLVIGVELTDGGYYMPLFVVLAAGHHLDDALRERIRSEIRTTFSPRHVPDEIIQAPAIPRTLNGKKVEVPIKRILLGQPADTVVIAGSLANPEALEFFVQFAASRGSVDSTSPLASDG